MVLAVNSTVKSATSLRSELTARLGIANWPQHYVLGREVSIEPQSPDTVFQKREYFKELAETFDDSAS
jgi:hypothetical protein